MNDWHPEDLKATIRKRGSSVAEIARRIGMTPQALGRVLDRPGQQGERAIAKFLGVPAQTIWPSRYHPSGRRRSPQPTANYRPAPRVERAGAEA